MTGKELKAFAAAVHDDAVIEMRERSYEKWEERFSLRARLEHVFDWEKKAADQEEIEKAV